jgi:DNA damage-binding protein 1
VYRTSTAPVDVSVTGNLIAVADLMKSISIVESSRNAQFQDEAKEIARHFSTVWTTALGDIGDNQWLVSDAEGNLIVLRRNVSGVTSDDKRRLEVTSEMLLGEMVNRIRPVNIPQTSTVAVTPKAFLGTVCPAQSFFILHITDDSCSTNRSKDQSTFSL